MSDEKKNSRDKEMPSKLQKWFRKRWVFPALYLAVAAIAVATVLWVQNSNETTLPEQDGDAGEDETAYEHDEEAVPTVKQQEVFAEPVASEDEVEIKIPFYDANAPAEEQEAALVFYNNTYYQNKGIDYTSKSGEAFDVTAAMAGNVVKAEEDELLGHVVEIEHEDGVTTIYQSLADVSVKEGDKLEQGDHIGQAGRNTFNKDAGIHVHFEIRKDGVAVNPIDYFGKSTSAISTTEDVEATENMEKQQDEDESEEKMPHDEKEKQDDKAKPKDASAAMTNV